MQKVFFRVAKKHKAKVKIRVYNAYRSFKVKKTGPLLNLTVKAAKSVKIKPKIKKTGGGSDANIFNALGIPTVIIGAGADRVHTTQERVLIDHMVKSVSFVLEIINEVAHAKR